MSKNIRELGEQIEGNWTWRITRKRERNQFEKKVQKKPSIQTIANNTLNKDVADKQL